MLILGEGLIGWVKDESGVAYVLSSDEKRVLFLPKNNVVKVKFDDGRKYGSFEFYVRELLPA